MEAAQTPASPVRRALLPRIAVVLGAIALGLVLHHQLRDHLDGIAALANDDLVAARVKLALVFEVTSVCLFGLTGSLGVVMVSACRQSLALQQFPPPGRWSWGNARKVVTGAQALRMARIGIALGITLIVASAAGGGLTWYMAQVLRACRAGVT